MSNKNKNNESDHPEMNEEGIEFSSDVPNTNKKWESDHPEMNEEGVVFSSDVPNTIQELIDLNLNRDKYNPVGKFEEVDFETGQKLSNEIKDKCNMIAAKITALLSKLNSGPHEDLFLSFILINRVFRFNKKFIKKISKDKDVNKEFLEFLKDQNKAVGEIINIFENELDAF
jgi:hypothetical protein|tara:strand:+ start:5204 stop:5719 length:516 start_codon:yes stop_codon:yes gene_type:complete